MEKFTFNEETHEYRLGDKILPSVTTILEKTLFERKYEGIDENVLKKAAEYGSLVHSEIEQYIKRGALGFSTELYNYITIQEENKIRPIHSELQIHDDKMAGTIDIVAELGGKGKVARNILADIKTTYKLDKEYVSWQLSFYAYMYEKKYNVKIHELYAIWLRENEFKLVKVERKTKKQVENVLQEFENGSRIDLNSNSIQTIPQDKQIAFCSLLKQMKAIEEQTKQIKEAILKEMEERNITSAKIGNVTISYKAPYTKTSIDSDKLKKDNLYEKYTKTSNVKGSISIKLGE